MKAYLRQTILTYVFLAAAITAAAGNVPSPAPVEKCDLFTTELKQMLPPEISDFVERYLHQRLYTDKDAAETRRRLDFDEVECSFPLTPSSVDALREADGMSILLERGRRYRISWLRGVQTIGEMGFPASFNLILFTNQKKSYEWLCARLRELAGQKRDEAIRYVGHRPDGRRKPFCRPGVEFYLGHLTSDIYLDSVSGRPVWSEEFAPQSLANLFVDPRPVADIDAEVSVKSYTGDIETIRLPFSTLRGFLEESGTHPYFGVSSGPDASGAFEAVAVYHNPTVAYLHKMELTVRPGELWRGDGARPAVSIELMPYIKLHNLDDLWGEK